MKSQNILIGRLDPHTASPAEQEALNLFANRIYQEHWPDDQPKEVTETIESWRFVPRFLDIHQWAAWTVDRQQVVARSWIGIMRTPDNQHMAEFDIAVHPEFRRQGIARRLLQRVVGVAVQEERSLLYCSTDLDIPASLAFMQRLGAQRSLVTLTNQLILTDLDRELVKEWQDQGHQRARGFELGFWDGPYPDADLRGMQRAKDVINQAPMGELDVEEFGWTGGQLRQVERSLRLQGINRWTLYARHQGSGEIAGFTEILWNSHRPALLEQGDTAVLPQYRNQGLALYLKAEMLARIVAQLPEARYIRTNNAESNTAMIRINQRLGFKTRKRWATWQVDLSQLQEYLEPHQTPTKALSISR